MSTGESDAPAITADSLLGGRVRLYQPARGARMSLDPVLLAGFVAPPYGRFLDIGCGTGALAFLLLARDPEARGAGVELQPELAALARRGRGENGWDPRLEIVEGDVRALARAPRPHAALGAGLFDLVATNPPYRPLHEGNVSTDEQRAIAHHEVTLTLDEWLDVAARLVRPGGRVAAILPAHRLVELTASMRARALTPVRLRAVHPHPDRPASRILVEAQSGARHPLSIEPPLIVHAAGARYTDEVRRMLGEAEDVAP